MSTWHCKTETVFDYTWNQVVRAYWNRYPNPSSSHVLSEDTISREIRDGKLYSRRLLSKVNPVPKWGEVFYKNIPIKIVEDSVLDLKKKTLITFTRNIGHKKIMKVDEIVEYSEQNDGRTLAIRRAYISSQVFGFSRAICAFGIERFKSNCQKTANGFNYVLRKMFPYQSHQPHQIASSTTSASMNTSTTVTTASASMQSVANQAAPNSSSATLSRTETVKKATKSSYMFLKNQAIKMAQLFSIKN